MTKSRLVPVVVLLGACVGAHLMWRGGASRGSEAKPDTTATDTAEAAGWAASHDETTLVVDYRDDVTDADLAATPEVEEPLSRWSAVDRVYWVHFASAGQAADAARRLRADPRVESVSWDAEATITPDEASQEIAAPNDRSMQAECAPRTSAAHAGFPSDPCYRYQWHLNQIGLPAAWKLGQGDGVLVAVIDTGVSRVPDLADTKFVPGYNFVADNEDASDDHGHGTHVAGTIAQSTHNNLGVSGVAFKAAIMPLKVLSARGSGSMAAIAQAIRFAADHGAKVVNMSLGGPMPVGAIGSAVKYAHDKGVTVIAAAGNDGRGKVSYPARYPGVVAVAATQFDGSTTIYSNWGPQIDLAAPGGSTRVAQHGDGKPDGVLQNTIEPGNITQNDYLRFMGTSMAAPHAAGVAALIVGAPGLVVLPFLFGDTSGTVDLLSNGVLDGLDAVLRPSLRGTPLVWSLLLPLGLTAVGYGVPRLRGVLAGFGFGVAGALLFAAIAGSFDVRLIPNLLDRPWLAVNALASAPLATAVLRRCPGAGAAPDVLARP